MHLTSPRSAFKATRLSKSTFIVKELNDIYDEHPLIYIKVIPEANTVVCIDTGCGGASKDPDVEITSLRQFLETVPVPDNEYRPLNDNGMEYIVITTHVHFDHILGIEDFANDSRVLVSGADPAFVAPEARSVHSLCTDLNIRCPQYTATLVGHMHAVAVDGVQLGLTILHTPGHTPDELAVWDEAEGVLYVDDTLYERAAIIFPNEGSIVDWWRSVENLLRLVQGKGAKICAGHVTAGQDAEDVLKATLAFMRDVLTGKEEVVHREQKRGESFAVYFQEGGRFSLGTPERLVEEAKQKIPL